MTKVLIVDDNKYVREGLVMILEDEGHEVSSADSAITALEMLESGELPGLIISDYNMKPADGVKFYKELQTHDILKDIPVVFLTLNPATVVKRLEGLGVNVPVVDKITAFVDLPIAMQNATRKTVSQTTGVKPDVSAIAS